MTTRKATEHDLETLLFLGKEMYEVEQTFEPLLTFSPDEARERYTQELHNENALLAVAEVEGSIAGYLYAHIDTVSYLHDTRECELEVVFVSPQLRGQGIAQELIDFCVAWARAKGVGRFKAGIFAENESSKAAFQKYGFRLYHQTYLLDSEKTDL